LLAHRCAVPDVRTPFREEGTVIPFDRRAPRPQAFTAAELTVLLGLVRRAKVQAERRREKRQHLQRDPPGSPGPTKADRLKRLFAKLEALRAPGGVPG
jgi:hypothetical protein